MNVIPSARTFALVAALGASLVGCASKQQDLVSPVSGKSGGSFDAPAAEPTPASPGSGDVAPSSPVPMGAAAGQSPSTSRAPSPPLEREASRSQDRAAPDPVDRPGLGTEWGETRESRISSVSFVRADASSPFATASVFYNDVEGARSMSSGESFRRFTGGTFTVADGAVGVGLRDEHGGFLTGFTASGKSFVVGEAGRRYTIVLENRTQSRLEAVLSVDGLDVLDGRQASFKKRGYLIDAGGELEVDGFRQSSETVAAFRFGSVRGSYASQKHGDARNVGVIGVAVFNERGSSPFPWNGDEVNRRRDADPFPGRFATPPG